MPTYEYSCTECGERLEAVQKFSDSPLTVCAVCGGRLRKLFSPVGIVFKGSGFYRTDSRTAAVNGAKDKQLNGSSDSPSASEKSSGADAKPAASESGSSAAESKPQKKTESGGSGKSSSAGAKVA